MTTMHRIKISVPNASGGRKGWLKHVTRVDATKRNGYAFSGEFLNSGWEDLPEGAVVVECAPTGSRSRGGKAGRAYRVTAEGLEPLGVEECQDWHGPDFLRFRDEVAAALDDRDPRAEAVEQIRALMAEHSITLDDLS